MDQLNKASGTVPLSKRYRYPPQQQGPTQVQNQMYQQQPNVAAPGGYGYSDQQQFPQQQNTVQQQQQPFGQQPQQYQATPYSPYVVDSNASAQAPVNYANASQSQQQQQQYSQFAPSQSPTMANFYPPNAPYGTNPNQPNYGANQYANNPAGYNVASQSFGGQIPAQPPPPPPQMNANYQSQPYNPQARY